MRPPVCTCKILEKNPQSEECLVNLITIGMARKETTMPSSNIPSGC